MSASTPSSAQQRNKRARIDPSIPTVIPDPSTNAPPGPSKVPKVQASAVISAHTATLLPSLATILQTLGDNHLDLLHRQYTKSIQLRRMESDDTIIPRSARLNFELSVPKSISELPDFITLMELTNSDVEKMKTQLRQRIFESLQIMVKFYTDELRDHLATALHTATAAILINNDNININVHRAVAHLLSSHHADILKHTHSTLEEFKIAYSKKYALVTFPSVLEPSTTLVSNNSQSSYFSQTPTQPTIPTAADDIPQLDLIYRTICCIFTSPFDAYIDQHRKNRIELELKKLTTEHLTTAATSAAQSEVEEEDSADRVLLNELVQKETKKNTSHMAAESTPLSKLSHS